jgi:hypothetical protein
MTRMATVLALLACMLVCAQGQTSFPPPHVVADWGGYTPLPASAVLTDKYMCDGYSSSEDSSETLAQCRASCDSTSGCAGFSWGLNAPPSPPPPILGERRRTLLAHDEPAVADVNGSCYLTTSMPTSSSNASSAYSSAGCYAKGAPPHLPARCTVVRVGCSGAIEAHC